MPDGNSAEVVLSAMVRKLLSYAGHHKLALLSGMTCLLAANSLKAVGPLAVQRSVDSLNDRFTSATLLFYSGVIVAIALVQAGFTFMQERLILGVARSMERDLKHDFYSHLQKLSLEFFQQYRTGDLMARYTNDVSAAVVSTPSAVMCAANHLIMLAIILPLMARLSGKLAVLAFAPLLLVILTTLLLQKWIQSRFKDVQESFGQISIQAQEALWSMRTVRAYTQEQAQMEGFREVSRQSVNYNLRHTRLSGALYSLLQFFIGLGYVAVLWQGGDLMAAGTLSLGQFLQFILYFGYLAWPMYALVWELNAIQKGKVSMDRIEAILSLEPAIQDSASPVTVREIRGAIEFRDVSFQYPGADSPALSEISFCIAPGQIVGLTGTVGSGKSTLLNMIPRFLEPGSGEILVDGYPIRKVPLKTLRSSTGYVPQETFLFSDTIAANVAFGNEKATEEEIAQAAMDSGVGSDVSGFPHGYRTMVGERGATLSGGQKQRISIARAILPRPSILLLDDALSSVDLHTEKDVLGRLRKVMQGKTLLIASHRISTLKDADVILVLREGRIIEQGSHDELLSREGTYAQMHLAQLLEEDLVISPHPAQWTECAKDGHSVKTVSGLPFQNYD
jgi:ATP-binding cassette, subfamily B, multidrug efflux pump